MGAPEIRALLKELLGDNNSALTVIQALNLVSYLRLPPSSSLLPCVLISRCTAFAAGAGSSYIRTYPPTALIT